MKTIPQGLLTEITRRLVAEFDPEAIYLFGSHAWGEPNEDSDLDLAVVVNWDSPPLHEDFVRARTCLSDIQAPMDILVKLQARFERYRHVPASLDYKIATKGKLLYGRTGDREGKKRTGMAVVDESPA